MKRFLALAAALTLSSLPGDTCCAFSRGDIRQTRPIRLDQQRAFLWHVKGQEHMLLSVKYSGGTNEFAWVIPVQSRPTVSVEKGAPFTELRHLTEIVRPSLKNSMEGGAPGGAPPIQSVTVLERREEGPYDLAVLEASSGVGLYKWLKENDFHLSKDARGALDYYVSRKFVFVAARIRNGAKGNQAVAQKLREGNIAPMHLTFKSPQMTYPLKVTSANPGSSELEIYVVGANKPTDEILANIPVGGRGSGSLTAQQFTMKPQGKTLFRISGPPGTAHAQGDFPTLRRLIPQGGTLTKFTGELDDSQRQHDLVFADL